MSLIKSNRACLRNKTTSPTLTRSSILNPFGWCMSFGTWDKKQCSNHTLKIFSFVSMILASSLDTVKFPLGLLSLFLPKRTVVLLFKCEYDLKAPARSTWDTKKCRCHGHIVWWDWFHRDLDESFGEIATPLTRCFHLLHNLPTLNDVDVFQDVAYGCLDTTVLYHFVVLVMITDYAVSNGLMLIHHWHTKCCQCISFITSVILVTTSTASAESIRPEYLRMSIRPVLSFENSSQQ